jgi:hypothetical protein
MKQKLTPVSLRIMLFVGMFAIVGIFIAALMLGYKVISNFSNDAKQVSVQADASNSSFNNLVQTKKLLENNKDVVERASQIVSESKSYVYQDQIISDLNQYANSTGVVITNITFGDTQTTASAAPTAAPAAAAGAPTAGAAVTQPGAPTGVKSKTATVTIKNPVGYTNMLNFLHLIEQSLFKMKISQVSLSRPSGSDASGDTVNSDALTIEVYIR